MQVQQPLMGLGGHAHCIAANASTGEVAVGCGDNTIRVLSLAARISQVKFTWSSTQLVM